MSEKLTVSEFAAAVGVTRQAVYKRLDTDLKGYVTRQGRTIYIDAAAVNEVYKVDNAVDNTVDKVDSDCKPELTTFKPSVDMVEYLRVEVEELKNCVAERDAEISRLNAEIAALAERITVVAEKAIQTTAQQQYLTAAERINEANADNSADADGVNVVEKKLAGWKWGIFRRKK